MPRKKKDDFVVDDDEMDFYDDDNKLVTEKPKKTKKAAASSTGDKPKSNYFQFMNRAGPVALGSKEVPSGPPECLLGKTFVVTGIPPSITREDMEDLIKRHGGRVTSAVSGKTSFLVVGNEPGQTKIDKAKKMRTPQIDEDGLFDMIRSANGANGSSEATSAPAAPVEPTPAPKKEVKPVVKSEPSVKLEDKPVITPARNYSWMQPDSKSKPPSKVSEMWVDKYKPGSISEIVGNNSHVQDIIRYLKNFDPNQPYSSSNTRAVLITGPPGIGKTTAAHLACKETGYDALEFNASDVRNKAAIQQKIGTASSNHSITSFFGTGGKKPETKRLALILDEIDGMSGGDRGGVQEVIKMIKTTKVPIICIANDRMNTKVRSLANYCKDLKFSRPTSASIKKRIEHIAAKENLALSVNVIDKLVNSTQNDIRQIINLLSTWKLSYDSLSYDQANAFSKESQKNQTMGPFDVTQRYFNGSYYASNTIQDRFDYYFNDFSIIPLMVQENYINSNPRRASPSETPAQQQLKHLELLSLAADSISEGDIIDRTIYNQQNWSLMPVHSLYSCVAPSYYMHGGMNGMINFAGWLGKNSTATKNKRILQELHSHMKLKTSGDRDQLCQQYLPTLVPMLVKPLADNQTEGISEVIELMDEYYLTKEDWDNMIEFSSNDNLTSTLFKQVPSNVKSAFTRTYNKTEHPTAFAGTTSAKKSKAPASSQPKPDLEDVVDDDEAPADEEESEESDELEDKLIKKVKKTAKRGSSSNTKPTSVKKPRKSN